MPPKPLVGGSIPSGPATPHLGPIRLFEDRLKKRSRFPAHDLRYLSLAETCLRSASVSAGYFSRVPSLLAAQSSP